MRISIRQRPILSLGLIALALVMVTMAAVAQSPTAGSQPMATTIVVDSTDDLDNSNSKECKNYPAEPCTLRRAVIEARNATKPATIEFDIPDTDPRYDSTLDIWRIEFKYTSSLALATLRQLNGNITIDGSTQPGGRSNGPKIVLVGPGTGQHDGIKLGENLAQGNNVIRGLAFQNFGEHLYVASGSNTVEDNWFGLSDDGTEPYLRDDEPEDGSGTSGVAVTAGANDNVIQGNWFLGLDGVAAAIRGDNNTFSNNFVGTTLDGTVPGKLTNPQQSCTPADWLGGGGISLEGDDHTIEGNTFAGLRQEVFKITTQPDAIRVTGTGHLIQDNKIGQDGADSRIGVCGRGIFLSDGPKEVQVLDNLIIDPGLSAISLNGVLYDENTLTGNVIINKAAWPQVEGNPVAEDAIQVGASMPDAFKAFYPAQVTDIDGTAVSGTAGAGSPCANCTVEIFLDDGDSVVETLQSLAVVTAGANGTWSANLPSELATGQGLRTLSTTAQFGQIPGMKAGTTSQLSKLYGAGYMVYLPYISSE
jgi:hypothetical protein